MGVNGTITRTNLKGATGIADDRLSAHHPNGAGNQTAMGNFLITDFGRFIGSPEWTETRVPGSTTNIWGTTNSDGEEWDAALCIPQATVSSSTPGLPDVGSVTGTDPNNDGGKEIDTNTGQITFPSDYVLDQGDRFWIRINTGVGQSAVNDGFGEHYIEQVLIDGNGLSKSLGNCTFTGNYEEGYIDNILVVDLEFEMTEYANSVYGDLQLQDSLNTDVLLYGDISGITGGPDAPTFSIGDTEPAITFLNNEAGESNVTYTGESGSVDDGSGGTFSQGSIPMDLGAMVENRNNYSELWLWAYVYDGQDSPAGGKGIGCPGDGEVYQKIQMNQVGDDFFAQFNHAGEPITANNDPIQFRYVITDGSSSTSNVVDQRDNEIPQDEFPSSSDTTRYTKSMGAEGGASKGNITC